MEPKTTLAGRLAPLIKGIIAAIGIPAARIPALNPILTLVYRRIFALIGRLDRLAVKFRDGTLPKPRRRAPKAQSVITKNRDRKPELRLPTRYGWLYHIAQPVAQWAPHIERFVNDPDTIALAAAAPQAGRLLRPLCRLMMVPIPDHLRLPPRPRKPRAPKPSTPKPRAKLLPPLSSHTPAPAGTGWLTPPPDHLRLRVPGLPFRPPDARNRRFRPD